MEKLVWHRTIDISPQHPYHVYLPYHVIPMWSNQSYEYCQCAKCTQIINEPCRIGLQFFGTRWKVIVYCRKCVDIDYTSYCGIPVMEIEAILKPILDRGCQKPNYICTICGKQRCGDKECIQVYEALKRTELDDLFEHFINIKLDIVTPLRYPVCHNIECNRIIDGKQYVCDTCRRVCYCSKVCKRSCESHHCIDYWECWK
jgi:hypothetical protein